MSLVTSGIGGPESKRGPWHIRFERKVLTLLDQPRIYSVRVLLTIGLMIAIAAGIRIYSAT